MQVYIARYGGQSRTEIRDMDLDTLHAWFYASLDATIREKKADAG